MACVVCFGEILIRLSAPGAEFLLQTPRLDAHFAGAEANVAVSLARLGDAARMVSVLPENALGRAALDELRRYGVDAEGVRFAPGRMGLYFVTPAAGPRAAEILYDRADSAFAQFDLKGVIDWPYEVSLGDWLHVSGVTAALSGKAAAATLSAAQEARRLGRTVSFDCNHRAKLWAARGGDGPADLRLIMASADVLFADHRDMAFALGATFEGVKPEQVGRVAADAAFAAFPELLYVAGTQRIQESADRCRLSASLYGRGTERHAPALTLTGVVDRIGAGDAFAAGLIHALRKKRDEEAALGFALTAAALKHYTPGDFSLAREADVEAVMNGAPLHVRR
jgi:2-dehydro-3-deoxygluconokinase